MLRAGETVKRTTTDVKTDVGTWPAGTFLVQYRAGTDTRLQAQAKRLGLTVGSVAAEPADTVALTQPRIGLYHGWGGNSDEGWTRLMLENFKLPYTKVFDADVRAGSLNARYDAIVLPDASYSSMLNGRRPGSLPPKYTGGMTQAGVDNLRAFVRDGGTLVTVNAAAQLPIRAWTDFPVTDVTAGVPSTKYYSPGSVLAGQADPSNPLAWGEPQDLDLYSDGSPAFSVKSGATGVTTPVKYPSSNILRSGWLLGEDVIAGQTAVADVKYGAGQVALLGISVQHRAQAHGTFKLLFNSLYAATEK
jgi:hypothetical protein